jgi:PQQ-dependent dehydrogenase (methanol/ethanol family)
MGLRQAALIAALVGVLALVAAFVTTSVGRGKTDFSISRAPAFSASQLSTPAGSDWITNGGSITNERYSTLDQINTQNVAKLKLAWQTHLDGSGATKVYSQEATPLVFDGVMYISTGNDDVFALNAATGEHLWTYHSDLPVKQITTACCGFSSRGVALGDGKVFVAQVDGQLVALDQMTGAVAWRSWNTRWQEGGTMTMAPLYFDGKVYVGLSGGEMGARGSVTAYSAATGERVWRFYTCPVYGEIGGGTWSANEWQHCGAAVWTTPSIDPALNLIYFGTGNPDPWSDRGPGDNLFANSFVALNADTGDLRWWYQTVHHDLWDYDVASPTVLFDVTVNGELRHAISAPGKTGWIYILDRTNGTPLLGIPEKKVPQEKSQFTSRTQPTPVGQAFAEQCAHKADYTNAKTGKPLKAPDGKPYKIGCIFTPYNTKQFVAYAPGTEGGEDWTPSSFSRQTHFQYVCGYNGSSALEAYPKPQLPRWVAGESFFGVKFGYGVAAGFGDARDPDQGGTRGGYLTAMDVTTNRVAWTVRLPTLGDCINSPLTTAGGLVFVGHNNTNNPTYSAYDAATGNNLWNYPTNVKVAISAPGITYTANGKQYVAVLQGGGGGNSIQQRPAGHGDIVEAWTLGE